MPGSTGVLPVNLVLMAGKCGSMEYEMLQFLHFPYQVCESFEGQEILKRITSLYSKTQRIAWAQTQSIGERIRPKYIQHPHAPTK
jgi:hypothetical protein